MDRHCHPDPTYADDDERSLTQAACEEQSIRLRTIHDLERRLADPKCTGKHEDRLRTDLNDLREIYEAAWLELENAIGTERARECRRQIESQRFGASEQLVLLFPQHKNPLKEKTIMQKVNGVEVHEPAIAPAASVTSDTGDIFQLPPELIQKLKAPLPAEAVSPNSDKPGLSSIKVIFVVERLNEVFGLNGWKVVNEVVESGQMVVVKATLTVPKYGITVEQFGGNNNFDRGDAYKGACTDALSKCAS